MSNLSVRNLRLLYGGNNLGFWEMERILRDEYVKGGLLRTSSIHCRTQVAVCLAQLSGGSAVVSSVLLRGASTAVCWGPHHTAFVFIVLLTRFGELCFFCKLRSL
jgi:hypothetical protein